MRRNRHFYFLLALMLLAAGCKKKPTGTEGPLFRAVRAGNVERVSSLISGGADVNAKNNVHCTPLHYAAEHDHVLVAELLIANGADVNAKTLTYSTPLHVAARRTWDTRYRMKPSHGLRATSDGFVLPSPRILTKIGMTKLNWKDGQKTCPHCRTRPLLWGQKKWRCQVGLRSLHYFYQL